MNVFARVYCNRKKQLWQGFECELSEADTPVCMFECIPADEHAKIPGSSDTPLNAVRKDRLGYTRLRWLVFF